MPVMSRPVTQCRITSRPLEEVINLGDLYVSDFVAQRSDSALRAPLRIGIDGTSGLLQLMDAIDRTRLYSTYWYRSGTNDTMKRQLNDVMRTVTQWATLRERDVVLDIGCNDGTFLSCYESICPVVKVGIDPAENLADTARQVADRHVVGFFDRAAFAAAADGRKAKVITTIAMFYGLEDPLAFVNDVRECLADDGIWVLQLSYTPLMLQQNAFDNICHEHVEYYTLRSLQYLVEACGLRIIDVEFNDTNAGSFRVVITHAENPLRNVPLFVRDVGQFRMESTLEYEKRKRFDEPDTYRDYMVRLDALRRATRELLEKLRDSGKEICGYGASTKGNTLLQYYGLGPELISVIAERQPAKWGLMTAGSWIPIASEADVHARRPDYLLALPWHFIEEFQRREKAFLDRGGRFIVPLPDLRICP
jgi:2-polyprenyl-3-methyl-5-hydroxy-6-metoxy-1,4-benzoquinol methylase